MNDSACGSLRRGGEKGRQPKVELRGVVDQRDRPRQRALQRTLQAHACAGHAASRAEVVEPSHPKRRGGRETALRRNGFHRELPRPLHRAERGVNGRRAVAQKRGRAGPNRIIRQHSGVTQSGGVGGVGAGAFIQPPIRDKAGFIAGEWKVLERGNFVGRQRAVPQSDFIYGPEETIGVAGVTANLERFGGSCAANGARPRALPDHGSIQKKFSAARIHRERSVVPRAIGHRSRRSGVNGIIPVAVVAIIKTPQMIVLHHERPAVSAGVGIFADDSLNDIGGVGRAEPRRGAERVGIQIVGVRHLNVAADAVKSEGVAGDLVENQRRAGGDPDGIADPIARVTVARGIAGGRAAVFIEVPEREQAVLVPVELAVLEIIDFGAAQRAIPQGDFINRAEEGGRIGVIPADLQRLRSGGRPRRSGPVSRTDLHAVQIKLSAVGIHRHRRVVPEAIRDRSRRGRVNRLVSERGGIVTGQMSVLHDQEPAVAAAVHVLADDAGHRIGRVGRPKPGRDGEGKRVEIGVVGHLHAKADAIKLQGGAWPRLGAGDRECAAKQGHAQPARSQNGLH